MTRDELIEKVAISIHESMWANVDFDRLHGQQKKHLRQEAEIAVNTIFDALKEPTEDMNDAARHLMLWQDGYSRPTYKNLKTHCRLLRKAAPDDCEDIDHVPPKAQRTSWIYQAMLAASPLAPKKD